MLLALREEQDEGNPVITEHTDPFIRDTVVGRMNVEIEKKLAYQRLSAQEKLRLAYEQYG